MSYIEPTTSTDLEIEQHTSLQNVKLSQRYFKLSTPGKTFITLLRLGFDFFLIYAGFLFSFFLRFSWINFDGAQPRPGELIHYLNLGWIYSFITILTLAIANIYITSYKASFVKAALLIAGVVLTAIVLITLTQLLDHSTEFFSRVVFAFLAPVSWLVFMAEFSLVNAVRNTLRSYNLKHHNMVVFAISLDRERLLTLKDNSKSAFVAKRALDLTGAIIILLLTAVPMIFIAIAVKLDSRGPVIFKQVRVGRNGKPFNFYKFRSMYTDADSRLEHLKEFNETQGATFKMKNDPRVTRVGRFLRRTSLDELPQLVNVLLGQMSLVGPRPGLPREVVLYEDWQYRRLEAIPGLTGLWQVSGRSSISFEEMTKLDIYYMYRCSPWTDLKILVKTVATVFTGKGAY